MTCPSVSDPLPLVPARPRRGAHPASGPARADAARAAVVERVREVLNQDTDIAIPVAAMSELADMLRGTKEQTLIGVSKEIDRALAALTNGFPHLVSLRAGCELFRAHVSQYASCEGVCLRLSPAA